ncbi:hypothetical protein BC826DRAFT_1000738 [Russula brevipes]|nr:hypothetical protein BC826DRAFT_1088489 [Russula brevipes]KAI0278813.1 hypothetical protein BC826DRAFT_1082883 [Russula brevipes]KAI0297688.1 hypothetical protein BC826DRAFT_1000738 [Russula brevipes]
MHCRNFIHEYPTHKYVRAERRDCRRVQRGTRGVVGCCLIGGPHAYVVVVHGRVVVVIQRDVHIFALIIQIGIVFEVMVVG